MLCFFSEKGVSIYLALMILVVVLGIAFGVSTILLSQIKMVKAIGDSVAALYAADTGIEKILYDVHEGIDIISLCQETSPCQGFLDSKTSFKVVVLAPGPDCSAENYCLKSVGIYRQTKRGIQVTR